MQCNRFLNADAALSIAMAKMKLGGVPVLGFAAVLDLAEKRYVLSSYHLSNIDVRANGNHCRLVFTSAQHRLTINASPNQSVQLKAPNRIGMTSDIQESINAILSVDLTTRIGKKVFKDDGINAGLEVVGDWK